MLQNVVSVNFKYNGAGGAVLFARLPRIDFPHGAFTLAFAPSVSFSPLFVAKFIAPAMIYCESAA